MYADAAQCALLESGETLICSRWRNFRVVRVLVRRVVPEADVFERRDTNSALAGVELASSIEAGRQSIGAVVVETRLPVPRELYPVRTIKYESKRRRRIPVEDLA